MAITFIRLRRLMPSLAAVFAIAFAGLVPQPAYAAYAFVNSGTYSLATGGSASVTYTATAGNTLVVYANTVTAGSGLTLSDGSNTYTYLGDVTGASQYLSMWWAHVTTGGSLTITLSGAQTYGLVVMEYSGLATSAYIAGSFQSQFQGGPGSAANAVTTSAEPSVTSVPAMLGGLTVNSNALSGGSSDTVPVLGTLLAYNSRTVGWLGTVSQQAALAEDVRITSTGTNPIAFGAGGGQFDNFYTVAAAFAETTGGSCTNNFWSSTGAWAVPNGTTGSYWSTTGAFLTPNCSTGSYWLKSGAKGAN
jgi:hypothetical protein